MGEPHSAEFRYNYYYLYNNNIGVDGCKYLCSAKWENLTQLSLGTIIIYLGYNDIDYDGC